MESSEEKPLYIKAIVETWWQSILSDAASLSLGFLFFLPGVYVDSSAMQWCGFMIFMIVLIAKGSGKIRVFRTKQQAIDFINSLNNEDAKP